MKRRMLILSLTGLAGSTLVAGCGGDKPPPPTTLSLQLAAAPDVNPDGTGSAEPLRVRILQLAETGTLSQTDFFTFDADPAKALGQDLLAVQDIALKPGQTVTLSPQTKPDAKFVGVVGSYYAIETSHWRAWVAVKPHTANVIAIKLNANGIDMSGGGA